MQQVTRLASTASLLMAYLDGILHSAPLLKLVASELHLVSGTLLQISGYQGQALGWTRRYLRASVCAQLLYARLGRRKQGIVAHKPHIPP